uniref:WASH complex subunit 4 n=1 Tax=Percolomonas cosmopolitus TaxID=63605 RepID=A0A6U0K852_9EUKA|mmetsp:Transcript_1761/g.6234  ORF Transcript_1761/g.6234 Transcript_1761/m.6234 type:complete len:1219 (+) Transcript_1761:4447-8103(+)
MSSSSTSNVGGTQSNPTADNATSTQQNTDSYIFDQFMDMDIKSPQDAHEESFHHFLTQYKSHLMHSFSLATSSSANSTLHNFAENLNDTLRHSPVSTNDTLVSEADILLPSLTISRVSLKNPPFYLQTEPLSSYRVDELLQTEHRTMRKILMVLDVLIEELRQLRMVARTQFYGKLALFGEGANPQDGMGQLQLGRILRLLTRLWNLVERTNVVLKHVLIQMAALYKIHDARGSGNSTVDISDEHLLSFSRIHFPDIFSEIAATLGMFMTFDTLIKENDAFMHCLTRYKRMIAKVLTHPEDFDTTQDMANRLPRLLERLENDILDCNMLINCLRRMEESQELNDQLSGHFRKMFFQGLSQHFGKITLSVGSATADDKPGKVIGLVGLFMLFSTLFSENSPAEKKLFKDLWTLHKRVPVIHIYGNTHWCLGDFLLRNAPTLIRFIGVKDPKREIIIAQKAMLSSTDASLKGNADALFQSFCAWKARFSSFLDDLELGKSAVTISGRYMMEGIDLAFQAKNILKTSLCLHVECEKPLTVTQVIDLGTLIHILKGVENTFNDNSQVMLKYTSGNTEFVAYQLRKMLLPLKKRIEQKRSQTPRDIDQLSTIELAYNLLGNAPTKRSMLLVRLAMTVAFHQDQVLIKDKDFDTMRGLMQTLDRFTNFSTIMRNICDCSLLYWQRALIPILFGNIYSNPTTCPMLHLLFQALEDVRPELESVEHLRDPVGGPISKDLSTISLSELYKDEILRFFSEQILDKLSTEVQEDLTRQVHAQVNKDFENPFTKKGSYMDRRPFFSMDPIKFYDRSISINIKVRHFLDVMFYRLTTASRQTQKTWKMYEEMRALALEKYGIEMTNVRLPGQNTDIGLDILEITRNIHIFVKNYSYNLNQNMFLEQVAKTDSPNLNVVNVRHVANSIRTHGTGIMNTTVNFVYKLLGRKFYTFSKFLYDDHIKSRLIRDAKFFRDNRHDLNNRYPLSRVEDFIREVRALGQIDGVSYLDKFRELITEIGNAMAYIRMVRTGGLRYIADSVQFVPDLDSVEDFEKWSAEHNLSEETQKAGQNLHSALKNLTTQFAEGSDYFQMLEKVFSQELLTENHKHVQNFFVIIPPLTQNFVDHIIKCKDRMLRNGKEANFTDDGFVLGVCFILKILNQNDKFKSLHWFQSVASQHHQEYAEWESKMNKPGNEDLNTMRLSLKRAQTLKKEFDMLFFSFSGAQIFFSKD